MRHVDSLDYAERLLGAADWTEPASIAALIGKAQALLPSDIVVLPVMRVATAHLADRAGLRSAVVTRPDGAAPLKILLADERLRAMLKETLVRLDGARGGALLALGLPAPAALAQEAAHAAGLPVPAADDDLADDAAVYTADFLRAFAAAPVTALRLGSDAALAAFDAPVIRVAGHYGWQVVRDGDATTVAIPADTRPEDAAGLVDRLKESE